MSEQLCKIRQRCAPPFSSCREKKPQGGQTPPVGRGLTSNSFFILICIAIITSERAERVLSYLREKSEYSRPGPARPGPARPDPITLFKALYLRNRMSDRQVVFFDEYHLDVKVVWHGYHIASVPVMARGACQTWGTLDDPQNTLPQ